MTLDDRIRSSVDAALGELTARVDQDLRALIQQIVTVANQERDEALAAARRDAAQEAAADTQRQVEAVEARLRATMDETVNQARQDERTRTAAEVRRSAEAEAEQKVAEALAGAEARLKMALADADAEAERRLRDMVTEARVREREAEMAAVTRLLEAVRGLDGATSLSEALDVLAQAAAREASRAAVLILRNERLLGWRLSGFGPRDAQPKAIDLAVAESGVVGLAAATARPVTTRDSQAAGEGPGFAHLPADRMGLAVPVIVGGRVVAVVYADSVTSDGREHIVPSGWPEVIEILSRHAARCLEALSVQKAAAAPVPRFWMAASGRQAPAGSGASANAPEASLTSGPGASSTVIA